MKTKHGKLVDINVDIGSRPLDLFIGSASFEQRCLAIPTRLPTSRIARAVAAVNVTYFDAVKRHLRALDDHFGEGLERLTLFSDDPIQSARNISKVVDGVLNGPPKRVMVDITTFTRETLLVLLGRLFRDRREGDELLLAYSHAKEYSIGDRPEEKWLSKGIRDVRSVLGFPGEMVPSKSTHMIVLVGFEYARTLELVKLCEPTFLSLGVADSREEGVKGHQATNEQMVYRLRQVFGDASVFTFRAYDAKATCVALSEQMKARTNCNTVVVPMNTKISTVGSLLLALENEAVQLCYAPANVYNLDRYADPDDDYYLLVPDVR